MGNTSDISKGSIIKVNNSLYQVVDFGQNKTARSAAKVWAKLKGVDNSRTIEQTWNSGDTVYFVRVEKQPYQFLYKDENGYNFMNNETYEQIVMQEQTINAPHLMKDGQEVEIIVNADESIPLSVELPNKVTLRIVSTEPGIKGDTATKTTKPATLETGAIINVPLFVHENEKIKVNTQTNEYAERVRE